MEVTQIRENEDGSADFSFTLNEWEREALIRFAIIEGLKNGIKEGMKYAVSKDSMENSGSGEDDSVHGEGIESSQSSE